MKILLGRLDWRPYLHIVIEPSYVSIGLEFPRLHISFEWDWNYIYSYIDYHGVKDYRCWSVGIARLSTQKIGMIRRYIHTNEIHHYEDWR